MDSLLPITEEEFNKLEKSAKLPYYFTYEQAKAHIRKFQFHTMADLARWIEHYRPPLRNRGTYRNDKGIYCPKPHFRLPKRPQLFYKNCNQWGTPSDFLRGIRTRQYAESPRQTTWTYDQSKEFIHKLKFKSQAEFSYWCSMKPDKPRGTVIRLSQNCILPIKPKFLPARPHLLYLKQGKWVNWAEFLGCEQEMDPNQLRYEYSRDKAISLKIPDMTTYQEYSKKDPRMLPDPLNYGRRHGLVYKWNEFIGMPDSYDKVKYLSYYHAQALLSLKQIDSQQQYANYRKEFKIEQFLPLSTKSFYGSKYPDLYKKSDFIKQPLSLKIEIHQKFKKCFCVYRNLTNGVRMIVVGKSPYHLLLEMSMTKSQRTEFFFFEYITDHDHDLLLNDFCTFQGTKNRYYINDFEKFMTACRNRFKEIEMYEYVNHNDIRKFPIRLNLIESKTGILSLAEYMVMEKIKEEQKEREETLYGEINKKAIDEFGKI
jgi:hypothetical protein